MRARAASCRRRARLRPAQERGGPATGKAADDGADDEAEAEGGAEHAHALGPVLRGGDIGDNGLGDREVGVAKAGQRSPCEEHGDGVGKAEQQVAADAEGDGADHHRAPADAVGEAAPERRKDELHRAVGGTDKRDDRRGGVERLGEEGLHRDEDAKPDEIKKNGNENGQQRAIVLHETRYSRRTEPSGKSGSTTRKTPSMFSDTALRSGNCSRR